ncbi:MAG: efflux RND transporter periplasmic adaptor subunit [Pseudomonadales bacterium]|nr:efflux RND transporter periplasmic adaptor subunit [Pseudomonadales bacterium]
MSLRNRLIACSLLCIALTGCEQTEDVPTEPKLRPVVTMVVSDDQKEVYREFSGVAKAGLKSRLSFRISGKIDALEVKIGDKLENGQRIASLNKSDSQLELQKAQASVAQAQAEAKNAAANYGRIKKLYESETASRTELDNALAQNEAAKALVTQAQKQLALAKQKLSYTELFNREDNCVVATTEVEVGENVNAGSPVVTVNCGDTIKVETAVAETFITHIKKDDKVFVQFNAIKDERLTGTITEVGVDAQGTAYPVTINLNDPKKQVLPGMAAVVYFITKVQKQGENSIFLPLHVVQAERDNTFVYVVKDQGNGSAILEKRLIKLGQFGGETLQVVDGISAGEVIISKGINQLYDGMTVKYQADQ